MKFFFSALCRTGGDFRAFDETIEERSQLVPLRRMVHERKRRSLRVVRKVDCDVSCVAMAGVVRI